MIKKYYQLTKPGIIKGNLITAIAGFIFASKGSFDLSLFIAMAFGLSAIIASACVFNNYIDREIDAKMDRTKNRSFVSGDISVKRAMVFAATLALLGSIVVILFVNVTTFVLGLIAYVNYIVFYGIAKRKSIHGTLVGSISGAMPLTAGYAAVTDRVDEVSVTLFFIMVFWQMPHFYSIAIYRLKDYRAASLPVLPAVKGVKITKFSIIAYMLLFFTAVLYLYFAANMGYAYLIVMLLAFVVWFKYSLKGLNIAKNRIWAGKMFSLSLRVLIIFSVMISADYFLK